MMRGTKVLQLFHAYIVPPFTALSARISQSYILALEEGHPRDCNQEAYQGCDKHCGSEPVNPSQADANRDVQIVLRWKKE